MPLIRPFRALRPLPAMAADVAAPPYDVLSTAEARSRVRGRPYSFLHISKAEVDLPEGTDPHDERVYARAAANLSRMRQEGILIQDPVPGYYVYRMTMGDHVQTGLVVAASVKAYEAGRIRKHEFTRPDKEDDRVRQIDALNAQTGPVLLAYRAVAGMDAMLAKVAAAGAAELDVSSDGVRHQVWPLRDTADIAQLSSLVEAMNALYVADGHHRSAAAARVAAMRERAGLAQSGEEACNYFLAVMFPHDQMRILDYNRLVQDLNGLDARQFLTAIEACFEVRCAGGPVHPEGMGGFGMYLPGQWYSLNIRPDLVPADDPVARLDASLLQTRLLAPILGVGDPRKDRRIDFVGGIRGLAELERRVDSGEMAVAFSMFPTSMDDLMAVADAGEVMPPKSTWFEPKLVDGLVSHMIDG